VEETRQQQEGTILQVLSCFVSVLSSGSGTAAGDAMQSGEPPPAAACLPHALPLALHQRAARPLLSLPSGWQSREAQVHARLLQALLHSRFYNLPTPTSPPPHTDTDEATALQDFMLAALKSFVRRYNVQCAAIAQRIRVEVLGAEGVPDQLRAAVEEQLCL
jgi:hypothetical protein